MRTGRPYADPHVAGVGLGLVLLACFVTTGQGLGASGAFASIASGLAAAAAPDAAARNGYFASYLDSGSPWTAWIVVEVIGIIIGAAASAIIAGRFRRGSGAAPDRVRLATAIGGGMLMGVGAALARGCTSGLALSGGALLSVGAWLFMLALFASGFAVAPLVRKLWA